MMGSSCHACVLMCVPVCVRVGVPMLMCMRSEGPYGLADVSAHAGKRACSYMWWSEVRAVWVTMRVRVQVHMRESVRAHAYRATTVPDFPWR